MTLEERLSQVESRNNEMPVTKCFYSAEQIEEQIAKLAFIDVLFSDITFLTQSLRIALEALGEYAVQYRWEAREVQLGNGQSIKVPGLGLSCVKAQQAHDRIAELAKGER